jgi:hypothetical protein
MKRSRLKSNPAKTAAFHARGRAQGLARGNRPLVARKPPKRTAGLRRARPLSRSRPKNSNTTRVPTEVRAAVIARNGGWCVWARHMGLRCRAQHVHHLLCKSTWPQYAAEPANLVGMSAYAHMQHEHSPNDRLPWAALPAECQAFLRAVAAVDARAARFVRVKYPGAELD